MSLSAMRAVGLDPFLTPFHSFLPVVTLQRFAAKNPPLRREHHPLPAVGIMRRLADWIVRHYVDDKVFCAVVDKLMRFSRFEDKGVTWCNGIRPALVPNPASNRNNMVKFPLRTVGVIGIRNFSSRNAQ